MIPTRGGGAIRIRAAVNPEQDRQGRFHNRRLPNVQVKTIFRGWQFFSVENLFHEPRNLWRLWSKRFGFDNFAVFLDVNGRLKAFGMCELNTEEFVDPLVEFAA